MRKNDGLQATSLASWWRLFCASYEELIQSITTPVRADYSLADLGESEFVVTPETDGEPFAVVREDLQLTNVRNEALACSFWRRKDGSGPRAIGGGGGFGHWRESVSSYHRSSVDSTASGRLSSADPAEELLLLSPPAFAAATADPCVVYLHEMSSSRKECVYMREAVLAAGFSLFALDLSGSGMSEGSRVSFGHFEQDDVRAVLDFLYATGRASKVSIWGRGIGGAAALLHLRSAAALHYKSLMLTKAQALELQVVEDKETGKLLCVRPPTLRLPFRFTRTDVSNGDFMLLSIGNELVAGLSPAQCMQRIRDCKDARLRIAGYAKSETGEQDKFVTALTMDCSFGDLEQVITDSMGMVSASAQRRNLVFPTTMVSAAAKIIGRSVRKSGGFSLSDIRSLDDVPGFQYPCLFLYATKKDFFTPAHTVTLHDKYGGPKQLLQFEGVTEQNRSAEVLDTVMSHFQSSLSGKVSSP